MRLFPDFSPKKNETALSFGLSWSLVGSAIALTYLASCSYIIPENSNPPRYNTVLGEKRLPPKNPSPGNNYTMPDMQPRQQQQAPVMQPRPQSQQQVTPPSPRVQEQSFVENTGVSQNNYRAETTPAAAATESYSWWNPRGWFGDAAPAQPHNTPLRQSPSMNNAQVQAPAYDNSTNQIQSYDMPAPVMEPLPSSDGYPTLQNTPQSPLVTGQAQARDKLTGARSQMEAELDAANARGNQLQRDASAEPSILSSMPQYQQPAPSVTRPVPVTTNDAWAEPKVVEPAPRIASVSSNEISVSEPIQLRPPSGKGAPVVAETGDATSMSTMPPSTSTFDPMAGSTQPIQLKPPEGTYQGKRYLPESRYVTRRSY